MGERTGRFVALATTIAALAAVVAVEERTGQVQAVPDFGPALADLPAPGPTTAVAHPRAAGAAPSAPAPVPTLAPAPEPTAPADRPVTPVPAKDAQSRPAPLRVLVRAIGLDAPVLPVGVTRQGDMSVPSDPAVAGWYRHGPAPADRPVTPVPAEDAQPRHAPLRVLVRAIGLDAPVLPVGVTRQGDMSVPSDPAVAGWYRHGPAPGGDRGSAVLAGHLDDADGALGTFALLREAEPGDQVEVWRDGAEPVRYRVTARTTVPDDALPPAVFRRDGPPVLTLITCAPPYVPGEGGYRANLVVVAEPVPV